VPSKEEIVRGRESTISNRSEGERDSAPSEKTQGDAVAPTRTDSLDQLDRILRSPAFSKSQRYSAFLRYCVERALDGKGDLLKERSVGVDVFDRRPDYDPGTDHVVRSAAAEVRKRLAQYYQDHAAAGELRIEVLPGSYVPQFSSAHTPLPAPAKADLPVMPEGATERRRSPSRRTAMAAAIVLVGAVLLLFWYRPWRVPTGVEWFWSPLLSAPKQVTIFIGPAALVTTETDSARGEAAAATVETVMKANTVSFASAASAAKISGFLQAQGKSSLVLSSVTSKFDDLQRGPAVLLGGLNNAWTIRLMDTLRFGFDVQDSRIHDRQQPKENWRFDFTAPYQRVTRDYAVISRVMHPATEQMTLIVAGLGQWGTLGAVDFITDPVRLAKLRESATNRQRDANFQAVIGVDVVNGAIGPPKILATYFW
jgi:hypothetical protein